MSGLKTIATCVLALAFTGSAWAEIYESKDAEGNPVFTDSPTEEGAEVVNLPETNLADAPPDIPEAQEQPEKSPQNITNNNVVVEGGAQYGGGAYDEDYDDAYARERRREALDKATPLDPDAAPEGLHAETPLDPDAPHEVLDGEVPHTVGDFNEPQRVIDRRPTGGGRR